MNKLSISFKQLSYKQKMLDYQIRLKGIPKSKRNTIKCIKGILKRYYS